MIEILRPGKPKRQTRAVYIGSRGHRSKGHAFAVIVAHCGYREVNQARRTARARCTNGATMENDILEDLKSWLTQLVADKNLRPPGEQPGVAIKLVNRAIDEIKQLRAAVASKDARSQ